MILLLEINSDLAKELFYSIPNCFHKTLMTIYEKGQKMVKNKHVNVKVSFIPLLRKKFIYNNFKTFQLGKVLKEYEDLLNKFIKNREKNGYCKYDVIPDEVINALITIYFMSKEQRINTFIL